MDKDKKYGLFTAITMIVGIVVGSGIFFKTDDILIYTNGNVLLGVGIFLVAAIAIVFGSLSVAQLAMRTDEPGGIISYAEKFVNKKVASAFGWFQTFLYLPTLIAIVSWVSGIYIIQLFNIQSVWLNEYIIGLFVIIFCFGINTISAKFGGYMQNGAMIIKLIPLILFAVFGLIKGDPSTLLSENIENIKTAGIGIGVLSALAPIAFSFDGWIISTSICHEIKNSKRNLPLALILSPIAVLIIYILYFVGVSVFIGPERIMEIGDGSVSEMGKILFGNIGGKIILIFVIIAVIGTANGVVLASIRMPYALAIRNMMPFSKRFDKTSNKLNNMPVNSAILSFIIAVIWLLIHYITQNIGMRGDISEIAICVSYLNYCVFYVTIIRLTKKGEIKNKVMGYFVPIMAIIGSLIILSGSFSNVLFKYYIMICATIMIIGYLYKSKINK